MHFSRSIAASVFVVGQVLAQGYYGSSAAGYAASPMAVTMTSTATAISAAGAQETVHVVQVGGKNGSTIYSPNNVIAKPGDLVQFQFNAKNHSVVQSTFGQPCIPIQNVMPNKTDAFFSGFMPNNHTFGTSGVQLVFTVRVMDTTPIWFYCAQAKHCQMGMVGAINAPTSGNKTIQAFAALAALAPVNLAPGQSSAGVAASSSGALGGAATLATAAPSGVASATGGSSATAAGATAAGATKPPQQSVNAAPGKFVDAARSGITGIAYAGIAAFFML